MLRDADASWNEETMRFTVDWEGPDGSLRSLEISEDNEMPPKALHVNLVQIGIENLLKAHGQVLDYIYADGPSKPAFGEEEGVSDEPRASEGEHVKVSGTREFVDEQIDNFQRIRAGTFELPVVEEEEPGLSRSVRELPGVDVVVIPEPEPEFDERDKICQDEMASEPLLESEESEAEEIPSEESVELPGELPGDGGLF